MYFDGVTVSPPGEKSESATHLRPRASETLGPPQLMRITSIHGDVGVGDAVGDDDVGDSVGICVGNDVGCAVGPVGTGSIRR